MSRDKRSVEDLLSAIDTAPTFGMNARELILQATRRIAAKVLSSFRLVTMQFGVYSSPAFLKDTAFQ